MLSRFLVILVFVPFLLWIFLKGNLMFLVFTLAIIGVSLHEFYKMLKDKGFEVANRIGMGLGLFLPIAIYFQQNSKNIFEYFKLDFFRQINFDMGGFIVFALMLLSLRQIFKVKIENAMSEISYTIFGVIYVAYLFSYILLLKYEFPNGRVLVTMAFILIWTCDTTAYLVGKSIGGKLFKQRLAPKISPNKSIEGAIAGVLGVFGVILIFDKLYLAIANFICGFSLISKTCNAQTYYSIGLRPWEAFLLALAIGVFAELGDLVESKIKREFEIKDSGNLLLGHGGFLDRFDSALFVLPIVYFFMKYVAYY
ncbi:phosphatidate cytidylyltransferase [Leptotrichia sp. oral taxon 847]|uniref:phosphatidate cytidylyltransferase n=1 Tax=Leptotrichia sp. oral taxon 847 TaxID=1785996 RepID=UPI00076832D4|nr:phosphatidate cytidylyltransferase [Leptotrichia sp. oral taxon 847]AMD95496.1 phosphatidate cytidylyltransferase [Leptotrichia sp. oral taxon 847]